MKMTFPILIFYVPVFLVNRSAFVERKWDLRIQEELYFSIYAGLSVRGNHRLSF